MTRRRGRSRAPGSSCRRPSAGRPADGRAAAVLLLVAALAGSACGGDAGEQHDGVASSDSARAARGESAAAASPDVSAETSAASDSGRPLRAFRVRLRNGGTDTAVVVADAGAGARTLDTVPPADSAWVRVETRARRLEIRARSGTGGESGRSRYDLERPEGDTLLYFEVPAPGPAGE